MTGFKNFLLRGNLIELAVAFIMGAAFSGVVTAFTELLTSMLPAAEDVFDGSTPIGAFLNASISFLVLASVVYFFIVLPFTKARERYYPSTAPGEPADVTLLTEIRDILRTQSTGIGSSNGTGTGSTEPAPPQP